jgi:hypothetical protein
MPGDRLAALAERRWVVYGGGLALVLLARTTFAPSTGRRLLVAGVCCLMAATYAGELWVAADREVARPRLLVPAAVGLLVGLWLTLGGNLVGLLFLGGGVLFLGRGIGGGEDP